MITAEMIRWLGIFVGIGIIEILILAFALATLWEISATLNWIAHAIRSEGRNKRPHERE